jgi:hypothetical protein
MQPISSEEFERSLRDAARDQELLGRRTSDGKTPDNELAVLLQNPDMKKFCEDVGEFIVDLATQLRLVKEPKTAFKLTFDQLDDVDRKRFVISNILEAYKRGEEPDRIAKRFESLGLIKAETR